MKAITPIEPRRTRWLSGLSVAALAALMTAGCHQESQPAARETLPTATVTAVKVTTARHATFEDIPGTVVPRVKSALEAKVVGRIVSLTAESGQSIKAGQTLLKIDAPEIQARADQALSALKLAEQESQRTQNLFARQAATRSEVDAVTAQLNQARAAAAEANVMLGYLSVVAPFDGIVSRKLVDVGDLASPGKTLIEIEQPTGKRFEAAIPETLIGQVKPGATLKVSFDGVAEPVAATVAEIDPAGDPGSRSWRVKFDLPAGADFRSGTFGRVAVPRDESSAIVIPASAVIQRGQLDLVFVVAGGQASLRLVKTGRSVAGNVEILSGLQADESVVVNPTVALKDGQPVNVP